MEVWDVFSKLKVFLNHENTLFVNKKADIAKVCKVLSCENRLKLLDLSDGTLIRKQIDEILGINSYAVTKHLNKIKELPDKLKILNGIHEGKKKFYIKKFDYVLIAL